MIDWLAGHLYSLGIDETLEQGQNRRHMVADKWRAGRPVQQAPLGYSVSLPVLPCGIWNVCSWTMTKKYQKENNQRGWQFYNYQLGNRAGTFIVFHHTLRYDLRKSGSEFLPRIKNCSGLNYLYAVHFPGKFYPILNNCLTSIPYPRLNSLKIILLQCPILI